MVGGLPLICVGGAIGLSLQTVMMWYEVAVTNLFINSVPSLAAFAALIISLFAYWWIVYGYWKRKGLDLSLAYKEVPPL